MPGLQKQVNADSYRAFIVSKGERIDGFDISRHIYQDNGAGFEKCFFRCSVDLVTQETILRRWTAPEVTDYRYEFFAGEELE